MRDLSVAPLGVFAVGAFGALCAIVMGVGAVAIFAELGNTWTHYFFLEQTVATATPVTTTLLAVAVVTGLLAAATS